MRVEVLQAGGGSLQLLDPDVLRAVDDLALQVGNVDHIGIDDADRADAGRGQVQAERRAQPARADQQHLGGLQLLLAGQRDLRHDQVPAVAHDLIGVQGRCGRVPVGGRCATGDGRHDGELAALFERRVQPFEVADVLFVEVDVHERAQVALVVEQVLAQCRDTPP